MKFRLFALVLFAVLQSCMNNSTDTLTGASIDAKLRQTIKSKNDSLLQAMALSDNTALKQLGSPDFIKFMHAKLNKQNVLWAFRRGYLDTDNYTVYKEYYNKHGKAPENTVITSEEDGYTLSYTNNEKETYISMLKCTLNGTDQYLVTLMYGLIDGKWKLNDIEIGCYGTFNRNAAQYYDLAEKAKDKDYIIDAFIYYDLANDLLEPAGKMMKYEIADEVERSTELMLNRIKRRYSFPQVINSIKSQPSIAGIAPVRNKKGFYPLINYLTNIPVSDTVALQNEFRQVKLEAKKIYKGLNFDTDFLYYRAYNTSTGTHHTFEDFRNKSLN